MLFVPVRKVWWINASFESAVYWRLCLEVRQGYSRRTQPWGAC